MKIRIVEKGLKNILELQNGFDVCLKTVFRKFRRHCGSDSLLKEQMISFKEEKTRGLAVASILPMLGFW